MDRQISLGGAIATVLVLLLSATDGASAQVAVSANDNKVLLVDGERTVPRNPEPDTVTIIDLNGSKPKITGEVQAPGSVVGPPHSVAVAPDESFALVTANQKIDPTDPTKTLPDDKVTVIDLQASPPKVLATLKVGSGPSGVSINRAGTLALVANRNEGTVSIFTISGKTLTPAGKLQLGDAKSGPSDVAFTPDGQMALVTRDGDHKISILAIDGATVEDTKHMMVGGIRPYALGITPNGHVAVIGTQGGGTGDNDVVDIVDLKSNPPRIVNSITVGPQVEGVAMAPDGRFVALTVTNYSDKAASFPFFSPHGLLEIYSLNGTQFLPVAQIEDGHWCQGAVWRKDGKEILVQCMVEREIQVFDFDGHQLKEAGAIKVDGGPAGIGTAAN
jgi:DNA-binding beta-propeller fold protein YncE